MTEFLLTRQLAERGLSTYDLERLLRTNRLERVRRGAYALPMVSDAEFETRHRRLVLATVPQLEPGAVVSHGSAAVLHRLPIRPERLRRVHVTRPRSGGGQRRSVVHVHVAPFDSVQLAIVDGVPVTSLARTVLDLGRSLPMHEAVAIGDHALRSGLDPAELAIGLEGMRSWPGVRAARRSCDFLDPRSESPAESTSRVRFFEQGIPTPDLQYEVFDEGGALLARSDFCWEERRTLGEFDGKVKYGRLLRPGQSSEDVVFAEKLREDALRDRGWQVVRWTWSELDHPEAICDRLRRAFDRSARLVGVVAPIIAPAGRIQLRALST